MRPTLKAFDAFIDKLQNHDWYYSFSDDGRVYRAGVADSKQLEEAAKANEYFKKAHQAYCEYIRDNIRGTVLEVALRHDRDLVISALRDGLAHGENNWDDTVPGPVKSTA